MCFPLMRSKPTYTLNIPELSGGVNYRDGISLIKDNQLTDCKNVWYKDGMLKTRPRVTSSEDVDNSLMSYATSPKTKTKIYDDIKYIDKTSVDISSGKVAGGVYCLMSVEMTGYDDSEVQHNSVALVLINENEPTKKIVVGSVPFQKNYDKNITYLLFQYTGDIYCLWSGENADSDRKYGVCKFVNGGTAENWEKKDIADEEIYAPVVYDHCKQVGSLIDLEENGKTITFLDKSFTGTQLYSFNLISNYYKAVFSTVNKELFTEGITKIPMEYSLPIEITDKMSGMKVIAKITHADGKVAEHIVTLSNNGQGYETKPNNVDNLIMNVKGWHLWFEEDFDEEYTTQKYLTKNDFIEDNMELTLPRLESEENINKIFCMTKSTWFGGDFHGLYGGTRLFLCANTLESEKSLMAWSYINNPLYFPEGCIRYVDDTTQAVTAFGKMSNTLVVFKERKIYQATYVEADAPTGEQFINQQVIDLASQVEYFPLMMINDSIGCDCPETIQLCRNRLVWATSHGKIYTLMSQNKYNERSIFEVSEMVENRLKKEPQLVNAHSADYDGCYVLQVENRLYLMDYNSYGYSAISSYSKNEDANIHIPWFCWELPVNPSYIGVVGEKLVIPVFHESEYNSRTYITTNMFYIDGSSGDDQVNLVEYKDGDKVIKNENKPIFCALQTKLFDFGQPSSLKSIPIVNISFGYNNGVPISVRFISERQIADNHTVTINGAESEEYSPEYIHSCRLFPYTKGTVRFGAVIECNGLLAIDSMSLQYRALGGAK